MSCSSSLAEKPPPDVANILFAIKWSIIRSVGKCEFLLALRIDAPDFSLMNPPS